MTPTANSKRPSQPVRPEQPPPSGNGGNGHANDPKARLEALRSTGALRRSRPQRDEEEFEEQGPLSVNAGPVGKVIELTFNPTREKIREVTVVDRMQGRLFPQLDMVNTMRKYCMEIATYRQNAGEYRKLFKKPKPVSPDALDEFLYRTAQWQKSVGGKNMDRAIDIALAETEARAGEDDYGVGGGDPWKE